MKINIHKILAFLMYHAIIINIVYLNNYKVFSSILVSLLFVIFILLFLSNYKRFEKYRIVNLCIIAFSIIVLFSCFINFLPLYQSLIFIMAIITTFLGFEWFEIKNIRNEVIKQYIVLTIFYLIISDFLMIFYPNLLLDNGFYYLIGNKFRLSYMHSFCSVLLLYNEKNKKKSIIFLIISALVSLNAYCLTGVVLDIIIIIYILLNNKKVSSKKAILVLLMSGAISLFFTQIIKIDFIMEFISSLPDKTSSIFGRSNIYLNVTSFIKDNLFLGHGFGTSYDILMSNGIGVNTQNSVLEILFQFGTVGLISFIIIVNNVLKSLKKDLIVYGIYALIIGMFYISCVEITIDLYIFVYLSIINSYREDKEVNS